MKTTGLHVVHGAATGVLNMLATDAGGAKRLFDLPATAVPGLGRHLFFSGPLNGRVYPLSPTNRTYILVRSAFDIPLRRNINACCST